MRPIGGDIPLSTIEESAEELKRWLATQSKAKFTGEQIDRAVADFHRVDASQQLRDEYAGMDRIRGDRILQAPEQEAGTTSAVHQVLVDKARGRIWRAAGEEAEAKRKALHPLVQMTFPIKGAKVGVKEMSELEAHLAKMPALLSLPPIAETEVGKALAEVAGEKLKAAFKAKQRLAKQYRSDKQVRLCQAVAAAAAGNPSDALAKMGAPNPIDVLSMLNHLYELGVDGGRLPGLLQALDELRDAYVQTPQETKALPDPIMKFLRTATFSVISLPVLKGIELLGPQIMERERDPALTKFLSFTLMIHDLSQDKELFAKLHDVCRLPVKAGTDTAFQYPRIVNLVFGLTQIGARDVATRLLDLAIENKEADFNPLARAYLSRLAVRLGQDPSQINLEDSGWNLEYVHLLPTALHESQETLMRKFKMRDQLEELIRTIFTGSYDQWVHDPETARGKANAETKAAFENLGLDYGAWLNYDVAEKRQLPDGREVSFSLWKRDPGYDLFQGTYAQSCAALNGGRGQVQIDDLQYTLVQTVEIKDAKGQNIGNAPVYFAEGKNGVFLVADTTQIKTDYRKEDEIRNGLSAYLEGYGRAVAGKDVPIRLGTHFNRLPTEDLKAEPFRFEVVGATESGKYHLNSLVEHQTFYVLNPGAGPQRLRGRIFSKTTHDLYTLSEPAQEPNRFR